MRGILVGKAIAHGDSTTVVAQAGFAFLRCAS